MREVAVIGVGMTKFAKWLDRGMKDLSREAVEHALEDAGIDKAEIQTAYVGNAMAGLMTGQECIRGQVVLHPIGISDIPIINLENACASSSTAFQQAWMAVASGLFDIALALGVEKLYAEDKMRSFRALGSAMDVEAMLKLFTSPPKPAPSEKKEEQKAAAAEGGGAGKSRSVFMDVYAQGARRHMELYGTTVEQLAKVSVKNHHHGCLNPHAQYQIECTVEEVLNSPMVAPPLTRLMCSPLGDGAAAAIICSADIATKFSKKPVHVAASVLRTGTTHGPDEPGVGQRAAKQAYEMAGLGPQDVDVCEVHDATVIGEIMAYEELGFCPQGEGGRFIDDGKSEIGGEVAVNTSGGLCAKGHPVGATGVAQIAEVVWQLRGEAGERQHEGAKVGLTHNGGGVIGSEAAALSVHILKV